MDNELISIRNLSKRFGNKKVLNNVNLSLEKGQSIALVGNNGSGKSTLLRMICGLTNITSGEIKYSKKLRFNYVPEHFPKMNITASQYIKHMGMIEGIPEQLLAEKMNQLFQIFYMEDMTDIPMRNLSKGTLQKVAVIQAIISEPDVLLLDEPLSGQDVKSQKNFIALVSEMKRKGVTVIMSCHEMYLVNQLSDTAYEIRNHNLEPLTINYEEEYEYDILVFDSTKVKSGINQNIIDRVKNIEYDQSEIKLVVSRKSSNEILIQMLNTGFTLRSMKGIDE